MLSMIDYNNNNIVPYFHDLYNKLQKKQLILDQFVVKDQEREVSDAIESSSKRAAIGERERDHDEYDDAQHQSTPQQLFPTTLLPSCVTQASHDSIKRNLPLYL